MKFFTNVLRWLLGLAAFCHSLFALVALYSPDQLAMLIGIGPIEFSYAWVGQAGILMFIIALMSIPALYHPEKFRAYVWILSFGTLLEGIFWYWASHQRNGSVFAPFAMFWLIVGIVEVFIILLLAEREIRLSFHNFVAVLDQCCEAWDGTNMFLRLFGYIVLAQAVLSFFPIYAHLFHQSLLRFPVGAGVLFHSEVWISLSGVEMIVVTALLIPTGFVPARYYAYCWLTIVSATFSMVCWTYVARQPLHFGFIFYALVNFMFALAMLVTFQIGAPKDKKFSPANYQRFLSYLANTLALHNQPVPIRILGFFVAVMALFVTGTLWYYFLRQVPDLEFGSDEMQLKYGAIGLSVESRVPVYLFMVMPYVFPELIPPQGGPRYVVDPVTGKDVVNPVTGKKVEVDAMERFAKAVGVFTIPEDGVATPVGFSQREIGFKSVEPNCGLCHVMKVTLTPEPAEPPKPGEPPKPPKPPKSLIVYGAPNSSLDIQAYQWFLYNAAVNPNFNSPTIMQAIEKRFDIGFLDQFFYRTVIIPATQYMLQQLRDDYLWQDAHGRSKQGRGRTDTFNTTKLGIMRMEDDGTTGTTDLPAVWQLGRRHYKQMYLHWDGNNGSVPERNYTAAMAVGASPMSVIEPAFDRLIAYLWRLKPAPYPYVDGPYKIDPVKAAEGKKLFITYCADCHSWSGNKIGQTTGPVGTDPNRSITFSTTHCNDFKKITYPPFVFPNYRKHKVPQYVNVPLDGLWLRAPYLHHGAVPTLSDLLKPVSERAPNFYRGGDVFDPVSVGFVSTGTEAEKYGTYYDTSLPGNCNIGHTYGTTLAAPQKVQLIEYLKTDDELISGRNIPIPWPPDTTPSGPLQPCEVQTPYVAGCDLKAWPPQ